MQPSYDSWDYEPPRGQGGQWGGGGAPPFGGSTGPAGGFEDPNIATAFGLVDISKGKGKCCGGKGGPMKGKSETFDNWDSWDSPGDSWDSSKGGRPNGMSELPRPPPCQGGGKAFDGSKGGGFGCYGTGPGGFGTGPEGFGGSGKGMGPMYDNGKGGKCGKGGFDGGFSGTGPAEFGKGPNDIITGKYQAAPQKGSWKGPDEFAKSGMAAKGDASKGGNNSSFFSYKGKLAPRKAEFPVRPDYNATRPGGPPTPPPPLHMDGRPEGREPTTVPPPPHMTGKGPIPSMAQLGKGLEAIARGPLAPSGPRSLQQLDVHARGPMRPPVPVAPRMQTFQPGGKGMPPRGPAAPADPRAAAAGLGTALAAVAARGGAYRGAVPPPMRPMGPGAPRPMPPGFTPPPPTGPVPPHLLGQGLMATLAKMPHGYPPQAALPGPPSFELAPELAALVSAGEGDNDMLVGSKVAAPIIEKKPRIFLLVTRLAPELEEGQLQQIIEQCGEVQAFRRGRDSNGDALSFGFAQFGDAEAAWKASTCLSRRVLGGQEIKVLVEESAEVLIQQWRKSQQAVLKVGTDEELDWELERKAVSCKALIDAKVEELFGPPEDGTAGSAIAQRKKELREREQARLERTRKRKAWREDECAKELALIEAVQKRMRLDEQARDDADRVKEEQEKKEKEGEAEESLLPAAEEAGGPGQRASAAAGASSRRLADMVDAEARDELFRLELNLGFLRAEKILERKLRPWLERKVDLCMGGPQSDLVEYILRRINANSMPDSLISELTRYLDDNAEPLVERMWRMLAFELMRNGLALPDAMKKKDKKEEKEGARA